MDFFEHDIHAASELIQEPEPSDCESQPGLAELYSQDTSDRVRGRPPSGKIIKQRSAFGIPLTDINMVSQPRDIKNPTKLDAFCYQDFAGIDQTIYTADSALYLDHYDFVAGTNQRGEIGYLYLRSKFGQYFGRIRKPDQYATNAFHGTATASRAVGEQVGVSKNSNLKLVPIISPSFAWQFVVWETMVDDMKKMRNKKEANGEVFIPVVYISYEVWTYATDPQPIVDQDQANNQDLTTKLVNMARKYFLAMVELDAFIAVAAGNNFDPATYKGHRPKVISAIALFAEEEEFRHNMLVVGAANYTGEPTSYSRGGDLVKILAPMVMPGGDQGGLVAASSSDTSWAAAQGTSFAVPMVAAAATYFLSIFPELRVRGGGRLVAKRVLDTAYPRCDHDGCLPVLYNGAPCN